MFKRLIVTLIVFNTLSFSNPLMQQYFSELHFDTTGWKLELLNDYWTQNFDGWYFTSISDTGYFRSGISFGSNTLLIITEDSLLNSFTINQIRDTIYIHEPGGGAIDWMFFGDTDNHQIVPPNTYQSLNRELIQTHSGYTDDYLYLDNSPTIGFENDWIDAMGIVEGIVTDSLQIPIEGVKVVYYINHNGLFPDSIFRYTDVNGHYTFNSIARVRYLQFLKCGFEEIEIYTQVYPDSTVIINQEMISIMQSVDIIQHNMKNGYKLGSNYPNPFNSTTINYYLPQDGHVNISLYSVKGQFIDVLIDEVQNYGTYQRQVDFDGLSSGVYIIHLTTDKISLSQKCVYMK